MAELIAKSPCDGLLPLTIGEVSLTEIDAGVLTSIAPFDGQEQAVADALKAAHGVALPAVNRATGKDGARAVWFGRGVTMLMGPSPEAGLTKGAAVTDQSDAWTVVRIDGAGAEDVLARWVPLNLSRAVFKRGHTARSQIGHMTASITRVGDTAFQVMVFRSMAATLVHELKAAMTGIAARAETGE